LRKKNQKMKQTNSQISQLYIALKPAEETIELKELTQICDATSITYTEAVTKVDSTYFCNDGETTSIITGKAVSIAVSLEYDSSKLSHQYLITLLKGSASKCNGQYISLELSLTSPTTIDIVSGKAAIMFKTLPPSGAPTELAKLEFDIFPQDSAWLWTTKAVTK